MVIKFSRSQRRHDRARLLKNRMYYWGYGNQDLPSLREMPIEIAGSIIDTPHPCSCWMCGNMRHWTSKKKDKLTRQELKAEELYKDG